MKQNLTQNLTLNDKRSVKRSDAQNWLKQYVPITTITHVKCGNLSSNVHDHLYSWLGKNVGDELVIVVQATPPSEMMRSCNCSPYVSKLSTLIFNLLSRVCCKEH